jgi:glycosyltransferase 2 family protein
VSSWAGSVARAVGGAAVLAVLVWRLGTGPFVDGLRSVDAGPVVAAASITVLTTVCAAWRWRVVARGLGLGLALRPAVAAYYRSQFLNTTLPGGVLGDVYRAVDHGRDVGDVGRGVRAVAWERAAGQTVQACLALAVLVALPSPAHSALPSVLAVLAGLAVVVLCGAAVTAETGRSRSAAAWARFGCAVRSDVRGALLARRAWPAVGLASLVVVAGHAGIFLIAAHVGDPDAPLSRVLPLAMLVLLASTLPLNVAGWGPREGVAAWAFGAAGLGAAHGVAVVTVYGVLVISSCLPGGVALLLTRWRRAFPVEGGGAATPRCSGVAVRQEVIGG